MFSGRGEISEGLRGSFGDSLEWSWEALGLSWGPLGLILKLLGGVLGPLGSVLGLLGVILVLLGAVLEPLGAVLGWSWSPLPLPPALGRNGGSLLHPPLFAPKYAHMHARSRGLAQMSSLKTTPNAH